jgi:hypothetical protein
MPAKQAPSTRCSRSSIAAATTGWCALSIALVGTGLLALSTAACAVNVTPTAPVVTAAGVRFVLVTPGARSVAVAGSFNQWSISSHPLSPTRARSADAWTGIFRLPPGEHTFMFVMDGSRFVTPPIAEDFVDDGFGARNGVVFVTPTER